LALYRLLLFLNGDLVGEVSRDCADDLESLEAARKLSINYAVEVYWGNRLVARVKMGDEPLNSSDRLSG